MLEEDEEAGTLDEIERAVLRHVQIQGFKGSSGVFANFSGNCAAPSRPLDLPITLPASQWLPKMGKL